MLGQISITICVHRYYSFDPAKSLTDNLRGKTVLEFPSIYVVLKEHASDFKILGQGKFIFSTKFLKQCTAIIRKKDSIIDLLFFDSIWLQNYLVSIKV